MRVLFLTNLPSPYRVDFFNALGKSCELTVAFELHAASDREQAWHASEYPHFLAIFMKGRKTATDQALCPEVVSLVKRKWDAIIVGGYSTPTGMLAIETMRLLRIPFIMNTDGGAPVAGEAGFKRWMKTHFISAAAYWLSSGALSTEYLCHYGAQRERVFVYPFTSLHETDLLPAPASAQRKRTLRQSLGLQGDTIVLSVGRVIHSKAFDVLLDAAKGLPEGTHIYIIGGEATEDLRQQRAVNGLESQVHFLPFMSKQALWPYYEAADLFVLPTRKDVWGLVINEAMANGLPVVTTDQCVAGTELIVPGENGFIVPIDDPAALRQAMDDVLARVTQGQGMGARSLDIIRGYTIERMADAHIDALRRATESR